MSGETLWCILIFTTLKLRLKMITKHKMLFNIFIILSFCITCAIGTYYFILLPCFFTICSY